MDEFGYVIIHMLNVGVLHEIGEIRVPVGVENE